ncbi:hypothetical protein MKX01_010644, partial [Papaver californicum]
MFSRQFIKQNEDEFIINLEKLLLLCRSWEGSEEGSEYETDIYLEEDMADWKVKSIEEIPHRRPLTNDQKGENLMKATALLGVGKRSKDAEVKKII